MDSQLNTFWGNGSNDADSLDDAMNGLCVSNIMGHHHKTQRVRDPLHNLIEFDTSNELEAILWRVVQTRPFQRLRRVKQLGFSDLVYPGASHTRLAHSLGVFHTARSLISIITRQQEKVEKSKADRALAAALVHDLGHGPFSHAFEKVGATLGLPMANHETVSDFIIRQTEVADVLNELGKGFADDVADVIKGDGKKTIYSAIVSSQFDADRLDYMRRDRLMTGSQHAAIDFEWLLANLEIGTVEFGVDEFSVGSVETFVLGPKAIYAAEAFVLGLFQLYPTVYFHKTTRGAEKLFGELLMRVIAIASDGVARATGLPETHPIVRFAREPEKVESALALDDTVIWGALALMSESDDPLISVFAKRLRDRDLYKCVDIRTRVERKINPNGDASEELVAAVDAMCVEVNQALTEWSAQHSDGIPRLLVDEAKRTPYKHVEESEGPLDRINIRTADGALEDLQKRSSVVAALKPFKLTRVYVDPADHEARKLIDSTIPGETK